MTSSAYVADSGPLIGLARINRLSLLRRLAKKVVIPPAVLGEITLTRQEAPGAQSIRETTWLEVRKPMASLVEPLAILVDRGEAEALALAQQDGECIVLLDDSRARRVAERLGIPRIGTLGLLRRAKNAGLIDRVQPEIEALLDVGIYIHQSLVEAILKDVGEL